MVSLRGINQAIKALLNPFCALQHRKNFARKTLMLWFGRSR
jgi:hypothetical protein